MPVVFRGLVALCDETAILADIGRGHCVHAKAGKWLLLTVLCGQSSMPSPAQTLPFRPGVQIHTMIRKPLSGGIKITQPLLSSLGLVRGTTRAPANLWRRGTFFSGLGCRHQEKPDLVIHQEKDVLYGTVSFDGCCHLLYVIGIPDSKALTGFDLLALET